MTHKPDDPENAGDIFAEMLRIQGEAARQVMRSFAPQAADSLPPTGTVDALAAAMLEFQDRWLDFPGGQKHGDARSAMLADPGEWMEMMRAWYAQIPALDPERQHKLWQEAVHLWETILSQYGEEDGESGAAEPRLPRKDRRFADPAWREQPVFALIHQTYLLLAERIAEAVDAVEGLNHDEREQLRFATRTTLDALSPANFAMMNPVVLERTIETQGENLVRGMERLSRDLQRGQLTHTDTSKFKLGENVACTPGKVIHETQLFQLIQYSPATEEVLETPLVIFPPWINRF